MQFTNQFNETKEVTIGQTWVGFKCDIEQTGKVVDTYYANNGCSRVLWLVLENEIGFEGGYIGGQTRTEIPAEETW